MARGRSLLWLASIMALAAAGSWTLALLDRGPPGIHDTWPGLVTASAVALAIYALFYGLHTVLARRHAEAARSLIHMQTIAAAVVALAATGALLGGFRTVLVGLGLIGFGLTLALQRPILAIAGWASLVFGRSARIGDRIRVGDLAGDVLDITVFNTRLWEVGEANTNTPGRPTGRIVTVSNAIFLEKPVSNATSDTPVVFDEFVVNVSFESDLELAKKLLIETGRQVLDEAQHQRVAATYRKLTKGLAMEADFPDHPITLAESKPSWMEFRLRYLVDARRAGRIQSRLTHKWTELTAPHADAIPQVYPRSQPQQVGPDGRPRP